MISYPFIKSLQAWSVCLTQLSHWYKGHHSYRLVCFLPWPTPQNWQWETIKKETLKQMRWFQFCLLKPFHLYEATFPKNLYLKYISPSDIYGICKVFKRLWFLSKCATNEEAIVSRMPSSYFDVFTSKFIWSPSWIKTNDDGYVPFVTILTLLNVQSLFFCAVFSGPTVCSRHDIAEILLKLALNTN